MKEGWEYKTLGAVCDLYQPKTISTKEMVSDGLYDVFGANGKIGKYHSYNHENPEIPMTCRGATCGNINISSPKSWINGNAMVVHIKDEEKLDRQFLVYSLIHVDKAHIITGAAQPQITRQTLSPLEIGYPSITEQQSIVDYLDSAFAKIDAMKANAEKALNEAKALFQASLKEKLEPKEGWEEKTLGDICSDVRYGTSTPSNENGEYKYLRMNNITNDGFLDVSHYKTISLPEKELEKCLVKKGDIIFNRTNSRELVGKSCVFTEEENMVIAGYLIRIRLKEGFEPQFITYNMNLQRSLGLFQHLIVGAVHQANISANNIQKVVINYPTLVEQQAIVATLDSLKSKVDCLQENFNKISQECDALKQAILRQVFE